MKSPLVLTASVVFVIWAIEGVAQEPAKTPRAERPSYLAVVRQPTGEPILVVDYPWPRHARPSVEVRLFAENEADNYLVRPLLFVDSFMKGEVTVNIYHCQDRSEDTPLSRPLSEGGIDFELLGKRNSLGKPSVCVACRARTGGTETGAFAVYCLLKSWAVDRRTLFLDLPPGYFSRPGKIRVWFLRGKDIVWSETATWPGIGRQPKAGASTE